MDDVWRILGDPAADGTMSAIWCAAKATAVLTGAGLASLAMGRKAAAARHLVWALGLAGAIAVLPLAVALPAGGGFHSWSRRRGPSRGWSRNRSRRPFRPWDRARS